MCDLLSVFVCTASVRQPLMMLVMIMILVMIMTIVMTMVMLIEATFNKDLGFPCYHVAEQVCWQETASGSDGHVVKLERLRVGAWEKATDWLQGEVAEVHWQEVRQLLQVCKFELVAKVGHGSQLERCVQHLCSILNHRQCGFQNSCIR